MMNSSAPSTFDVSWQQDYTQRMHPELLTCLLRSNIPVLDHAGWYVAEVGEGFCQSILPLNAPTTNQHGTHQAALISLSADYTGGIALAALLRGVPVAGVHRCGEENSVSLWLASMNVKYKSPSSGHLTGTCRVDEAKAESIRRRYFSGQRVLVTLEIEFHSNGQQVAIAEMKYFAQATRTLNPEPDSKSRSTLFDHKLKASARMIAGIRARSTSNPKLGGQCSLSSVSAGPHGHLLADRLQRTLPQLTDMVLARSQHIDETIVKGNYGQVVMLGAGLDMRSLKHAARSSKTTFFELDLPAMIEERLRVIEELPEGYWDRRVMIPVDFKRESAAALLRADKRFDACLPTLFVYEGCTMYFESEENEKMLREVDGLMDHPDSRIWLDLVSQEVASRQTEHPDVAKFLDGMDELGESFIFGVDDAGRWVQNLGLQTIEVMKCGEYLSDPDPIFRNYQFVTVGPSPQQQPAMNPLRGPLGLKRAFLEIDDVGIAHW